MIKRIQFVNKPGGVTVAAFQQAWLATLPDLCTGPEPTRPLRLVACLSLPGLAGPDHLHDGISMTWFTNQDHLQRFESWLTQPTCTAAHAPDCVESSHVLCAREVVLRGAPWLDQRWHTPAEKFKHMALARRAQTLSPAAFSERWLGKQGRVAGAKPGAKPGAKQGHTLAIPETAKGLAYIQNHPVQNSAPEQPPASSKLQQDFMGMPPLYDAINEVYFDHLDGMQQRIDFFHTHEVGKASADLVRWARFLAVREQVVYPPFNPTISRTKAESR